METLISSVLSLLNGGWRGIPEEAFVKRWCSGSGSGLAVMTLSAVINVGTLASSKRAAEIPPQALPYIPCSVTATPFSGSSFSSIRLPFASRPHPPTPSPLPPARPASVCQANSSYVLPQPSSPLPNAPLSFPATPAPPPHHHHHHHHSHCHPTYGLTLSSTSGRNFKINGKQKKQTKPREFLAPAKLHLYLFVFIVVADIPTRGLLVFVPSAPLPGWRLHR